MKLVVVAPVIASPVARYALHTWLQGFAYRPDLGAWVFVRAGGLGVRVARLTVSTRKVKTALMNPVKSPRSEGSRTIKLFINSSPITAVEGAHFFNR